MTNKKAITYMRSSRDITCSMCDPIGYGCSECCDFCNEREAFNIAINAIKKQIPKKPIGDWYKCPNCENYMNYMRADRWCNNCGQAIDWSDENE